MYLVSFTKDTRDYEQAFLNYDVAQRFVNELSEEHTNITIVLVGDHKPWEY